MLKNPFVLPLHQFTFEEMAESLEAMGGESGQLEFKQKMIGTPKLANIACSFANAQGGLIVIGINDPVEGQDLEFGPVPETGDRECLRVTASLNARVTPALPLDVKGYRSADGDRGIFVIRIRYSVFTPHEFLGGPSDGFNFPVRRGTSTERLGLGEIEVLQLRGAGRSNTSPNVPKISPFVSLNQWSGLDAFLGLSIVPKVYKTVRRVMAAEDDQFFIDMNEAMRGHDDHIHRGLTLRAYSDSNYFKTKGWEPPLPIVDSNALEERPNMPPEQIEVVSDGDIYIRITQRDGEVTDQVINLLLWGYAAAQEVVHRFGLSPEVRLHLTARFDDRRRTGILPLPDAYDDYFDVHLATESFEDAFTDTIVRLHRAGDGSPNREIVGRRLSQFSERILPLGDSLRARWLTP